MLTLGKCPHCGKELATGGCSQCDGTVGAGGVAGLYPDGRPKPFQESYFTVCPFCTTKDTEIAELKAEIAKLREGQTFHPVSHRDAICPDCGRPLGEHVIVRQRDGMEIICPKDNHEQSP